MIKNSVCPKRHVYLKAFHHTYITFHYLMWGRFCFKYCISNDYDDDDDDNNTNIYVDDCLLWVLCVVRYRSLRRADRPSRWFLPSVMCLFVKPQQWRKKPQLNEGCCATEKNNNSNSKHITLISVFTNMVVRYSKLTLCWYGYFT
jgi:hypothetical protein